jgi:cellulose biosynthesis protein BcsQ
MAKGTVRERAGNTISLLNMKGVIGKTTLAVHLAYALV